MRRPRRELNFPLALIIGLGIWTAVAFLLVVVGD
jgi:hypothetical protein